MTDTAPTPDLPDLPEPAITEVYNPRTGERELSTHGAAYYGSNWRVERWLYTADQMRAERQRTYAIGHAAGVAAERERWRQEILDLPDLGQLPEPFDYCYEWDGPYGTRKFSAAQHNGMQPHRSVPLYTADQMRTYAADCVRAALAHPAPAAPVKDSSLTVAPAEPAEPLCACKDRPASQCPGQWEPGCDLGNNPAHVRVIDAPAEPAEPVAWDWLRGVMDGIPTREERIGGQREKYIAKEAVMAWLHEGQSRAKRAAQPPQPVQPQADARCPLCRYQHGHAIGCENNPVDIALSAARQARPPAPAAQPDTLCQQLQQKCSDWGVYWRAPDAHGVELTHDQALELLRDALGVEVDWKSATAQPVQAPPGWVPAHERVPAVGTECVVLVRYEYEMDKPPFTTVDKWDVQREDPIGMGYFDDPAYEGWNDNYECDVIAWLPIPPHPPAEWDQRLPDAAPAPAERDHG